ncbi:PEP-CTERM sorting domain-containing protein [Verrucomicrobium sp. BvORR106]|uniref:PEP-CTERM sorting domain-containing protein n=1 Tax=Verrucomicrobium sp. BvORR106 TaxID=1403819 RepID=UPI00056E3553|nr:PEP-CTERM sorting domain-containing protein [Verrucomicrobium sp. BvORR106]
MLTRLHLPAILTVALIASLPFAHAATVVQTANNAGGQYGYSSDVNWSPAGAPGAGNDYVNSSYTLRTQGGVFAGDSLTVGNGSASTASLLYKGNYSGTVTVNNLIMNRGTFISGTDSGSGNVSLDGNISIQSGGMYLSANSNAGSLRTITVLSTLAGSGPLVAVNGETGQRGVVYLNGMLNNYTGGTLIGNSTISTTANQVMLSVGAGSHLGNGGTVQVRANGALTLNSASNMDWTQIMTLDSMLAGLGLINLNYTGTSLLSGLSFDGGSTFVDPGVYDATHSLYGGFFTGGGSITVAPEPSRFLLLSSGAFALLLRRRRRA